VPESDLRTATLSGVKWVGAARVVTETVTFGSAVVIAHLVPPAEYGRAAVALLLNQIAVGLSVQGIGSPVVQRRKITREHLRAAVALSWLVGVLGTAAALAFAWVVAPALFGHRVAHLLVLMAPVFLLVSLAAIPIAQLERRLDFRRLAVIECIANVVGAMASVALAGAGLNAAALVLGMLAAAVATLALLAFLAPRERPGLHRAELRELVRFGAPATGSSLLYFGTRNVDYAILASRVSATQLGYYVRAFQLGSDYQAKISSVMLRVAFPVFSRTEDLEHLRRVRGRMVRVHTAVIFPLLFALIAVAPVLVPWLFGARWAPAAGPTQILAVAGMVACVGTGTGPLLLSVGRTGTLLGYGLGAFVVYAAAVVIAVPYGIIAVCVTVAVVKVVSLLVLLVLIERVVGISVVETLRNDLVPAGVAGLGLLGAALPVTAALNHAGVAAPLVLLAAGATGAVVYIALLRVVFPATWSDLRLLAGRLAGRASAPGAPRENAPPRVERQEMPLVAQIPPSSALAPGPAEAPADSPGWRN
jgi:O-antigen/teichoic acid export membrane protein